MKVGKTKPRPVQTKKTFISCTNTVTPPADQGIQAKLNQTQTQIQTSLRKFNFKLGDKSHQLFKLAKPNQTQIYIVEQSKPSQV